MKLKAGQVEGFLRTPDPNARAILVFGPDEGLVRERAIRLAKVAVEDLSDPFRVVQLTCTELKSDPAKLSDEASALSFGGGSRVVRVRQAGDLCALACTSFLKLETPTAAMVVIDAGDLGPQSKLRKLFEKAKNAVCIPCYPDRPEDLPNLIRTSLEHFGLTADRDAMAAMVQTLGADRSVTRGELEKLALYMGGPGTVTVADVSAAMDDGSANGINDVVFSAASGDLSGLERSLRRIFADGTAAVQLVRATQRHFQRLHMARGRMSQGQSADEAVRTLRPPLNFTLMNPFKRQLTLWPEVKLARAFEILTQVEIDCKTTGLPAETVCSRALMSLAQAARAGQRRA